MGLAIEEDAIVLRGIDDALLEGLQSLLLLVLSRLKFTALQHDRGQRHRRVLGEEARGEDDLIALVHQRTRHGDEEGEVDTTLTQGGDLHTGALSGDGHRLDDLRLDAVVLGLLIALGGTAYRVGLLRIGDDLGEHTCAACLLLLVGRQVGMGACRGEVNFLRQRLSTRAEDEPRQEDGGKGIYFRSIHLSGDCVRRHRPGSGRYVRAGPGRDSYLPYAPA